MKIPLVDLGPQHAEIADEALAAVAGIVKSGHFILGEPVLRFERMLAEICGVAHAVGVASGTDALLLALRAREVGEGDLVVTTPVTFAATAEAIVRVGARPVFCDVDVDTLNLDPRAVRARIEAMNAGSRARVRAIVPVHLFGRACAMPELAEIAREHGAALIEDAAQAIGVRAAGRGVGAVSDAACLSFFPSKNLGAWGDGGAVVTNDEALAARVRRLRAHGAEPGPRFAEVGFNSRLDAVQAAVLAVKAARLAPWTRARVAAAERYRALLAPLGTRVRVPSHGEAGAHVFHHYVIRVDRRDALVTHLARAGIEARPYYATPLHRDGCYGAFDAEGAEGAPHADRAAREMLAIPFFYGIDDARQQAVVSEIASFVPAPGR